MKIVYNRLIPFGSFKAITVGCFILVKRGRMLSEKDISHEAIHWEQQKELLVVFFYLLYCLFFAVELVRCFTDERRGWQPSAHRSLWERAYRSICFEREAYQNQADIRYAGQTRKHFAWLRYFD